MVREESVMKVLVVLKKIKRGQPNYTRTDKPVFKSNPRRTDGVRQQDSFGRGKQSVAPRGGSINGGHKGVGGRHGR